MTLLSRLRGWFVPPAELDPQHEMSRIARSGMLVLAAGVLEIGRAHV